MHATRKVKLKDLSQNLTCFICKGYFIDATTIIECVHSFCRACIVKHLEKSEHCPVCEVQLHSSRPLSSIRSDKMLQEIVYKLVPGLFQHEMTNRRQYYNEHAEMKPRTQQDGGQVFNESYITSDDMIHLSLEFDTTDKKLRESTKRFILCPAAVSIAILKKLIQGKYGLKNTSCIEIMYRERYLPDDFLLMDIAYKYSWSQNGNGPLQLYYRVVGVPKPHSSFKPKSAPHDPLPIKAHSPEDSIPFKNPRKRQVESAKKSTPLPKGVTTEKLSAKKSLTPTGRPRGRPKRKPSISSDEPPVVDIKKIKLDKGENGEVEVRKKKSKVSKKDKKKKEEIENVSHVAEVQLRISENGVISAKSVTSGEEKIINPGISPPKTSTPSPFNGICPSPIGFSRKSGTKNGNHSCRPKSPNPTEVTSMDQDSPMSLTKKILENGDQGEERKVAKSDSGNSPSRKSDHAVDYLLKVPTPGKWPHHHSNNALNGVNLTMVTKASPAKDSLGFNASSNTSSPSKKPPKFFKSRISESRNETNGHHPLKADFIPESPSTKTDLKVLTTNKSPSRPPTHENGSGMHDFHESQNSIERRKPESTIPAYPQSTLGAPSPPLSSQQMPHHQFSPFGLHVDDNLNMSGMGLGQMHFVPSMANGYCSFPFFPNPNPTIHPLLQMAMSMNLNSPFSYAHNSSPTPTPQNGNGSSKSQKKSKGKSMNNSLDLSMPSAKKPKSSSYVQISPKKSQTEDPKNNDKAEKVKGSLLSSASSSAEGFKTPPKKGCTGSVSKSGTPRKLATPKKIISATEVPSVPPAPKDDPSRNDEGNTKIRVPSPDKVGGSDARTSSKSPTMSCPEEPLSVGGSSDQLHPHGPKNEDISHDEHDSMSAPMPTLILVESSSNTSVDEPPNKGITLVSDRSLGESQSVTPVLATATLTVTLDETKKLSSESGPPGGKSPTTTINNNNNIVRTSDGDRNNPDESSEVSPTTCPSGSMIISSSTTTTTSSA